LQFAIPDGVLAKKPFERRLTELKGAIPQKTVRKAVRKERQRI